MNSFPILEKLCQYVAPTFEWAPMLTHMRKKFLHLDDITFETRFCEFLKFIYLRSLYGKGFIPLTEEIDLFWHEFILQTVAYEALCLALPGKHFIHHNSIGLGEHAEEKTREETIQNLLNWIPNYTKHFGPFTKEAAQYWMIVSFLEKELNLSLEAISQLTPLSS